MFLAKSISCCSALITSFKLCVSNSSSLTIKVILMMMRVGDNGKAPHQINFKKVIDFSKKISASSFMGYLKGKKVA